MIKYSYYCISEKSIFCLITDPDCYKLVLKNEASLAFEEKTTTVKNTLITTNGSGQKWVQSFSKSKDMLVLFLFSLCDSVFKVMYFEINSFYIFFFISYFRKSFRSVWICVFISVLIIAVVLGLIICKFNTVLYILRVFNQLKQCCYAFIYLWYRKDKSACYMY